MNLSESLNNVGELKSAIANELTASGFTDVILNESEVAGNRNGMRLSVLHLFTGGRGFYQQVMAAGETADSTRGLVNNISERIQSLDFM